MAAAPEAAAKMAAGVTNGAANGSTSWWQRLRWLQTSRNEGVAAERELLALSGAPVSQRDVPVGPGPQQFMHTLQGGQPGAPPLVAIAGYVRAGAGAGFFHRNLSFMARHFHLHAVDLVGTGLSGRPSFDARSREQAESFFVEALDAWRAAMGLDSMLLLGHSMGGYLAAAYAARYSQHVRHLILCCPAGVAARPDDWKQPEFLREQPWSLRANMYRAVTWGWNAGVTPGGLIRSLGPVGNRLVHNYSQRRFDLSDAELAQFRPYLYSILAARGSGEHALRHILQPLAWAYAPLERRLEMFERVPVSFIYGERDWMDPRAGQRLCEALRAQRPGGRPISASDTQTFLVDGAGHYPFLEAPDAFHDALAAACAPYLRDDAVQRGAAAHHVETGEELPPPPDRPPNAAEAAADL